MKSDYFIGCPNKVETKVTDRPAFFNGLDSDNILGLFGLKTNIKKEEESSENGK